MARIACWVMAGGLAAATAIPTARADSRDTRINLVDFARVVEFVHSTPDRIEARSLDRGVDGWPVWFGDDGQAMIGVEWDEPRDIVEANVEFRHAIAERHLIRVQYFAEGWPVMAGAGESPSGSRRAVSLRDRWLTPTWEWWAGDRDVSFAFKSLRQERPGQDVPDVRYRRTRRLRFLCGERDDLPAVRFLRAFGPGPSADATFDIHFDEDTGVPPPLLVSVVNGYVIGGDGKTTLEEGRIGGDPGEVRLRFAQGDVDSPNRTKVTLRTVREPIVEVSFIPAEVVQRGHVQLAEKGLTISHRGTRVDPQAPRASSAGTADPDSNPALAETQASPR